jgi:very-short-patch-repair endonuclease
MYFSSTTRHLLQGSFTGLRTEALAHLLDIEGDLSERRELINDLAKWTRDGLLRRERDGRWKWIVGPGGEGRPPPKPGPDPKPTGPITDRILLAAPGVARFSSAPAAAPVPDKGSPDIDIRSLLAYYAAALRSDVRGSVEVLPEKHGVSWQLVSAIGAWWPGDGDQAKLQIALDVLPPTFREALERRAGENSIAVGWPLSVGRSTGVDVVRPVGLLAATFLRTDHLLEISLERPDVVANPSWLQGEAGGLGWTKSALEDRLSCSGGQALNVSAFSRITREAAASSVLGSLDPARSIERLDLSQRGLHDAIAIFLPTEPSMTRHAVRDIDTVRGWSDTKIDATACPAVFSPGKEDRRDAIGPVLETGQLNGEQLEAVESGLTKSLSVVTGPPGTGKSQCVTALVSSVVAAGGRILVAARNHQALDAVEDRIGKQNVIRLRDRDGNRDTSLTAVARELVADIEADKSSRSISGALEEVRRLSERRSAATKKRSEKRQLELEIADLLDRLQVFDEGERSLRTRAPRSFWWRILIWFSLRRMRKLNLEKGDDTESVHAALAHLRKRASAIKLEDDPAILGDEVRQAFFSILPDVFNNRAALGDALRAELGESLADLELDGGKDLSDDVVETVLRARPVWLGTTLSLPKRMPLRPGLFDLVVIDEASQADIASAIPALARAKRAVVVGDDRQLTFIPSIGEGQERNLLAAAGLGQRKGLGIFSQGRRSLFDLTLVQSRKTENAHSVMLREQYRSAPEITDFIGESFYGGQLRPAVDPEKLILPKGTKLGLSWTDVKGASERGEDGGYINRREANEVTDHLCELLLEQQYPGSVGVIAPFNSQVGFLKQQISKRIPNPVRQRAELKIDTIDAFQGQERSLILISPVVAAQSPGQASNFLARDRRRFNVAVSRAQAAAHIFGDLDFARSAEGMPDLRRLAAWATEPRRRADDRDAGSVWEVRLREAMRCRGLDPHPQYPVLGRRLDFALFKGDVRLDVEVDGRKWHLDADGRRKADDVFRDFQLRSAGWKVLRFWVSELDKDMEVCVESIERELA